jgi:flavorubredoxin
MPLTMAAGRLIRLKQLDYVLASHQDPDIIAALDRWLLNTNARVVVSELWSRFLPHLSSGFMKSNMGVDPYQRMLTLPDHGMDIPFGDTVIKALPAHFLHSVGNFQFYDPVARILFSGDMGASATDPAQEHAVSDLRAHIPRMEGFHRRYMCSRKVCALWANMVRGLDVEKIVPQHGAFFEGRAAIDGFLDWIERLDCGIDLLGQDDYRIP